MAGVRQQTSEHEVLVYKALLKARDWMTAKDIATATGVANRTVRNHCAKLARYGLLNVTLLHGGFRYAAVREGDLKSDAQVHFKRLRKAAEVLDL